MYFIDDNKLDIRLYTDASDFGIGGVLFQVVDTIWQPIAFISKSLTPTQIRWSTIQKEAYAIFYCCTQLDYLIRDRTFTIYTDHLNITYMKHNPTSMVARWFIAMQELHFTVVFVPGTSNALADALSRLTRPRRCLFTSLLTLSTIAFSSFEYARVKLCGVPQRSKKSLNKSFAKWDPRSDHIIFGEPKRPK